MTLLEYIACQLDRSWQTEEQQAKLQHSITEGVARLARLDPSITEDSILSDLQARTLLKNYVFYDINSALDDFEKNYSAELMVLGMRGMVYLAQQKQDDEDDV